MANLTGTFKKHRNPLYGQFDFQCQIQSFTFIIDL